MSSDIPVISMAGMVPIAADGFVIGARMRPTTARTDNKRGKAFRNCTWPFFHFSRQEKSFLFQLAMRFAHYRGRNSRRSKLRIFCSNDDKNTSVHEPNFMKIELVAPNVMTSNGSG